MICSKSNGILQENGYGTVKRVRRLFALLLVLLLLLTACGGKEPSEIETNHSPLEILDVILDSQSGSPDMQTLAMGDEGFADYITGYYGLDETLLEDGVICYAGGIEAGEIAVLVLQPDADTDEVESALLQYIESRIGDFYGYMPAQVFLLEQAVVATSGNYMALLICDEPGQAQEAFAQRFTRESVTAANASFVPANTAVTANTTEEYDPDAILYAWRTGDRSYLSVKNRNILELCANVIQNTTTDHMSEYEKELAVHDWMIDWARYDEEEKNRDADASPHPDNDNPYGLLVGRRAICTGYAATFQLLMDMLEIECITVYGSSRGRDHIWNMVHLDGEWYCVDPTWNDPVGLDEYDAEVHHQFFNVTSQFLRNNNHDWEEGTVPEATGIRYQWSA